MDIDGEEYFVAVYPEMILNGVAAYSFILGNSTSMVKFIDNPPSPIVINVDGVYVKAEKVSK